MKSFLIKHQTMIISVFGCLCYASLHLSNNFSPRAIRCVFLGSDIQINRRDTSCSLLNLIKFLFHETIFPFLQDKEKHSSDPHHILPWIHDNQSTQTPSHVPHPIVIHKDSSTSNLQSNDTEFLLLTSYSHNEDTSLHSNT